MQTFIRKRFQLGNDFLKAIHIVSSIANDEGILLQNLPASLEACDFIYTRKSFINMFWFDFKSQILQAFYDLQCCSNIFQLVISGQGAFEVG